MREMKDSGMPWIGKIPKDWKTDKFKYHLKRSEPRNPGNQVVLSLYRDYGIIPKDSRDDNHNVTSEDTSNYKYVQIGDFVVNKMKAWQGSVAVSNYEGIVSPAYYVYKFSDHQIYKKYLHYLLRACYKDEFMRLSGGLRVGQWDLSADGLGNTYILIPPYDEQVKIADYLDSKKERIDSIREGVEAEIEALKEYKKSVITEAVTKGLDPDVEMKDSGIPWIGEIPKEWVICKVKNVVSHIGSGTTPTSGKIEFYENGTVNWIQSGDLYETNKINETNKKVSESAIKLFPALHIYKAKFIVIAMYGASVGNITISNIDACVNQACCCIKTNEFNNLKYMFYWLFSCKNDFLKITDGGGQPNISQTKIKNQYYLKPPIEEQHRIVDFLDTKCARIDSIIQKKQELLTNLDTYKKSLIYEYVTGKKEVPAV